MILFLTIVLYVYMACWYVCVCVWYLFHRTHTIFSYISKHLKPPTSCPHYRHLIRNTGCCGLYTYPRTHTYPYIVVYGGFCWLFVLRYTLAWILRQRPCSYACVHAQVYGVNRARILLFCLVAWICTYVEYIIIHIYTHFATEYLAQPTILLFEFGFDANVQ